MKILKSLKPKIKHDDPLIRLSEVKKINGSDQDLLAKLCTEDPSSLVRQEALKHLEPERLDSLYDSTDNDTLKKEIEIQINSNLLHAIHNSDDLQDKIEVIQSIDDEHLLFDIILKEQNIEARLYALERIHDQPILAELLTKNCGKTIALNAIKKINSTELLEKVAKSAANRAARSSAQDTLDAIEKDKNKPSPQLIIKQQSADLITQLEKLSKSYFTDVVYEQYEKILHKWQELNLLNDDPAIEQFNSYAAIIINNNQQLLDQKKKAQEKKNSTKQLLEKIERVCHELDSKTSLISAQFDDANKLIQDFANNKLQENANTKRELLTEFDNLLKAKSTQKASQQFKSIESRWTQKLALPEDCQNLNEKFEQIKQQFVSKQKKEFKEREWQRWQNKSLKEKLIDQANELDKLNDLHLVFRKIKDLQSSWRKIGPVPKKDSDVIWKKFKESTDRNFSRCQDFFKKLDLKAQENLQQKLALCKQAHEQKESSQWKKTSDFLKDLQSQWNAIGNAPKHKENELYAEFRNACDYFFKRRNEHYDQLDTERQANLKKKEELCLKVEELLDSPQVTHNKEILEIQDLWKKIGRCRKKDDDTIWQRFRNACDKYYDWLDSKKPENLNKKEALCEEVEQLLNNLSQQSNYQKISQQVINLQSQWKEIGPAPKEQHNKIWRRFKKSCDGFFEEKRKHFDKIDQKRSSNEKAKQQLIKELDQLVQIDTKESATKIIELQKKWKDLGPASKNREKGLNQKFKKLCEEFFNNRKHGMIELDRTLRENLKKKELLCTRLEIIAGKKPAKLIKPKKNQVLTLAEQLQLAFETNTSHASSKSSRQRNERDEIESIKQEWSLINDVPKEHEYSIIKRYNTALAALEKSTKKHEEN